MTSSEVIIEVIESMQGGKGPELVPRIVQSLLAHGFVPDLVDVPLLLQRLVDEGEIVEVEYVLPSMDYRLKSFYLPKGSKARLVNAEPLEE